MHDPPNPSFPRHPPGQALSREGGSRGETTPPSLIAHKQIFIGNVLWTPPGGTGEPIVFLGCSLSSSFRKLTKLTYLLSWEHSPGRTCLVLLQLVKSKWQRHTLYCPFILLKTFFSLSRDGSVISYLCQKEKQNNHFITLNQDILSLNKFPIVWYILGLCLTFFINLS